MKKIILLIFLFQCFFAKATIFEVGPSKTYISPNALYTANVVSNGDTILIYGFNYTGTAALAVWQSDDLLIKGVGGIPHLIANGQYIWGKGIWVCAGDNITVEKIEFSGASVPDMNGAGIRLDGNGLTVRHCNFHDNENGILTNNSGIGELLVEYSEFNHNGYGDGQSHNIYVGHISRFTFQYNYSHHAVIGHNLKSRANENFIYYNRIMDEDTGNSSRLIDLSNGGFSIIMGNIFMQGNNAENNNLIGYGKEGLTNPSKEVYIVNNTLVNKRTASCLFIDIKPGTLIANVTNNIIAGTGTIIGGSTTTMTNNYIQSDISLVKFIDHTAHNYDILSDSPAIDYGTTISDIGIYSLTPDKIYVHPTSNDFRGIINGTIDAGAYESLDAGGLVIWDGGGDNLNWDDPLNWDTDNVPTAIDNVLIDNILDNVVIPISYNATIKQLTNKGSLNVSNLATLSIEYASETNAFDNFGSVINAGQISFAHPSEKCIFNEIGATFNNNKDILFNSGTINFGIYNLGYFINQTNGNITGTNFINAGISNNSGNFENYGSIDVSNNTSDALLYNIASFNNKETGLINITNGNIGINNYNGVGPFVNEGTININNSNIISINQQNTFENTNTGMINITNTVTSSNAALSQNYGTLINDGTIEINKASASVALLQYVNGNSFIKGEGSFITNTSFDILANIAPGSSPGTLTFEGNTVLNSTNMVYQMEIESATNHDVINITGDIDLGGTLDVTLLGGFVPDNTDRFVLLTYTGVLTNTFTNVILPSPTLDDWILDYATTGEVALYKMGVLAINEMSFQAQNNKNDITLFWTSQSETDNSEYQLLRSEDNESWKEIYKESPVKNYTFKDRLPLDGKSYYKLNLLDKNGLLANSNTIAVTRDQSSISLVTFPNPASDFLSIDLMPYKIKSIHLFDNQGHLVLNERYKNLIDISFLASGVYHLNIIANGKSYHSKIQITK